MKEINLEKNTMQTSLKLTHENNAWLKAFSKEIKIPKAVLINIFVQEIDKEFLKKVASDYKEAIEAEKMRNANTLEKLKKLTTEQLEAVLAQLENKTNKAKQ